MLVGWADRVSVLWPTLAGLLALFAVVMASTS